MTVAGGPGVGVVTGVTSGIGLAAARALVGAGVELSVVARDPVRLGAVLAELRARAVAPVEGYLADLARLKETERVAEEIREAHPQLNLLINNAGAIFTHRYATEEGIERTFALNVLTPFQLTRTLLPALRASPGARVVNVASAAHAWGSIHFDDLEGRRRYGGWRAYAQSKLALILLTQEFARREPGRRVTFNACHPGFVRSRFGYHNPGFFGAMIRLSARVGGISPERGARVVEYLASSVDVAETTGGYFVDHRPASLRPPARDPAVAARLWETVAERVEDALTGRNRPAELGAQIA